MAESYNFTPESFTGWDDYFAQRREYIASLNADTEDDGAVRGYIPELVQDAVTIPVSKLPKQPGEIAALLEGRDLAVRHSIMLMHGTPYAGGQKAGQMRADKKANWYGIATVDGQNPVVTAYWEDSAKFLYADFGYTDGRRTRVTLITSLKKLLKEGMNENAAATGDD